MAVRQLCRLGVASIVLTGAGLTLASSASAHVSIVEQSAAAGSYTVLTFSVPHGCDGEATTGVRIQIPESIPSVTPTVNPNWDVEKVMEDLATPIDAGHGEQLTERVAEVVYTATTPLPDGLRDTFELSLKLPDDAAGTTIYFPVIQQCDATESAWIEIPEAGAEEPELPAPGIEVTAAGEEGHGDDGAATTVPSGDDETAGGDGAGAGEAASAAGAVTGDGDGGGTNGWGIAGFAAGSAGLVLGAVALARTRQA